VLDRLRAVQPKVEIETLEVFTNPARAIRDGIRMIPALIVGNQRWYRAPQLEELIVALNSNLEESNTQLDK
jgi:hypothetical protein